MQRGALYHRPLMCPAGDAKHAADEKPINLGRTFYPGGTGREADRPEGLPAAAESRSQFQLCESGLTSAGVHFVGPVNNVIAWYFGSIVCPFVHHNIMLTISMCISGKTSAKKGIPSLPRKTRKRFSPQHDRFVSPSRWCTRNLVDCHQVFQPPSPTDPESGSPSCQQA
jgi:hypothetical protein